MNQNLRVNKANFHMKGYALDLALKQKQKAIRKWPLGNICFRIFWMDVMATALFIVTIRKILLDVWCKAHACAEKPWSNGLASRRKF